MKSFSQLVTHAGNAGLVRSVQLSVLATLNGYGLHLHAEGVRGTGKTSILRACRNILPTIERIQGCEYNCDPRSPHCPNHAGIDEAAVAAIGTEVIPIPFLEISPSAKLGTVVGSLDLERLTDSGGPQAAVRPGTIPRAHRGIIFVDEINRLADTAPELADVLLDVMGTRPGRIQIEEAGLSWIEIPVVVSVWAASNPDEEPGPLEEIRRQLSDRFDFVIPVRRPTRRELVEQILDLATSRSMMTELADQPPPVIEDVRLRDLLGSRSEGFRRIDLPVPLRSLVAGTYVEFQLESLRAAEGLQAGARLNALLDGRSAATVDDLLFVAPLVLEHRVDPQLIPRILKYMEAWRQENESGTSRPTTASGRGSEPSTQATLSGSADQPAAVNSSPERPNPDVSQPPKEGERQVSWLQKAMNRLGGGQGAGSCAQSSTARSQTARKQPARTGTDRSVIDPTRTPILAPQGRAIRLPELDERYVVTDPSDSELR